MKEHNSIPREFKDKVGEVMSMCNSPECYSHLKEQMATKGEQYEQDMPKEDKKEPSGSQVKQFSMDDAPATMDN
jgi:hypothetical protein